MTVRITHFSGTPDRNQYEARLPMLGDATWRGPSESGTQRRLAALQKFGCDRSKEDIRGRRKRLDLSKMTQSGHWAAAFAALHGSDLLYL